MASRCVYKLICLINNRFYIGSTSELQVRFERHMRGQTHPDAYEDILKYGESNFTMDIIYLLGDAEMKLPCYGKKGKLAYHLYASNVIERTYNRYYSYYQPELIYNKDDNCYNWAPKSP